MTPPSETRPTWIWLGLVILTLASVGLSGAVPYRALVYVIVFGAAVIKGQMVAVHFMETGKAHPTWNGLYRTWIVMIGLALLAGHLFAPAHV